MIFLKPEEYLPKIEAIFKIVENRIRNLLPNAEVEHIGSSAINGAISKGDLDILVRTSKDDFTGALSTIQSLGFSIKKETLRTDSLCMLETQEFDADVAIQLIEGGSEFEDFVKFRDHLNTTPELVKKYNLLKIKSMELTPEKYRQIKSEFIQSILKSK